MNRLLKTGIVIFGSLIIMPSLTYAQKATQTDSAAAADTASSEDPNDKGEHDRSFEETRKHMMLHSEWSKKSMKMNDN